jgi:hypothetical protein
MVHSTVMPARISYTSGGNARIPSQASGPGMRGFSMPPPHNGESKAMMNLLNPV